MLVVSGFVSTIDVQPCTFKDGRRGFSYRVKLNDLGNSFYCQAVSESDQVKFSGPDGLHELVVGGKYDLFVRVETYISNSGDPRYSLRLIC